MICINVLRLIIAKMTWLNSEMKVTVWVKKIKSSEMSLIRKLSK